MKKSCHFAHQSTSQNVKALPHYISMYTNDVNTYVRVLYECTCTCTCTCC
uniref:Uncharacterized protein n=1 Tax=Glossina morsitans morsitans TaxID=37546 RepID=A0ABK9NGR4_GLOMM